eukprot:356135-Chlamydomonas_euryale.AAC.7
MRRVAPWATLTPSSPHSRILDDHPRRTAGRAPRGHASRRHEQPRLGGMHTQTLTCIGPNMAGHAQPPSMHPSLTASSPAPIPAHKAHATTFNPGNRHAIFCLLRQHCQYTCCAAEHTIVIGRMPNKVQRVSNTCSTNKPPLSTTWACPPSSPQNPSSSLAAIREKGLLGAQSSTICSTSSWAIAVVASCSPGRIGPCQSSQLQPWSGRPLWATLASRLHCPWRGKRSLARSLARQKIFG